MLNEIIGSTKQTLLERLTSPLLGSFAFSWIIWNWKFIVIILSNTSVADTFVLVETIAFPDLITTIIKGFVLPLATALVYIFLYPYPARYIYAFTLRRQREIREVKKMSYNETPLTIEESRQLRAEYVEYERRNSENVAKLNEEIARLNALLDSKNKVEIQPQHTSTERSNIEIEPSQLEILRIMDRHGGNVMERDVISASKEPKVKTKFDIGELEKNHLVTRIYNQIKQVWYLDFTHEGRRVFLNATKL